MPPKKRTIRQDDDEEDNHPKKKMAIEEIIDRKGEAEGHRSPFIVTNDKIATVDETISPESRAVMDVTTIIQYAPDGTMQLHKAIEKTIGLFNKKHGFAGINNPKADYKKAVKRAFFHDESYVASFEAKKPKIPLCVILPFLVAASNTSEFKMSRFSNRPGHNWKLRLQVKSILGPNELHKLLVGISIGVNNACVFQAYNISPRVGTFMNRTACTKDTSPTWFSVRRRNDENKTPYIPIYDGRNIEDVNPEKIFQLPILNETKEFNLKKDDVIMAGTSFFVKEDDWNLLPVWIILCKESEESNDTDDIEDFEEGY
ncbi:hypothetical protein BC829DRAFT_390097 [Chytridium lagenaria]|nr:hypothetical protein BC829DRAFT_390097 [Chytridium lagenaria]